MKPVTHQSATRISARHAASAESDEPFIKFVDVSLVLAGATIYENLSFDVRKGELLCLLGPSGCGKSTALRLMGDLLPVEAGTVSVGGMPPTQAWEKIVYVFQSPRLLPWKDALDNAAFGLEMRRPDMTVTERRERAMHQLERVGLAGDAHKTPQMLSGGERQRVAIARALALDPEIILMDEPFSALDPNTRTRLRRQLIELWEGSSKTIVFVTHDIEEALYLADRIILLTPKPAQVRAEIAVAAARPRDIDADPKLRRQRDELRALFQEMGGVHEEASNEARKTQV